MGLDRLKHKDRQGKEGLKTMKNTTRLAPKILGKKRGKKAKRAINGMRKANDRFR